MEVDHDEDDWDALTYARHHGLSKIYYSESIYGCSMFAQADLTFEWDLCAPSDDFVTNRVNVLTTERLAVSNDAALLLKAIHELQKPPSNEPLMTDRHRWMVSLKQEPPVLATDDELDLLNFGSVFTPDFGNLSIPLELVDQERDEGLEWPGKYLSYPEQINRQIKAEKLAVSKEVLLHLQDAVTDSYTSQDLQKAKEEALRFRTSTVYRSLTPPLLPLSPPLVPYIPSSPANCLPMYSDSSDYIVVEARELEQNIMGADSLERQSSDSSDLMLLDIANAANISPAFDASNSKILKRRAEDLKVEGPLTPQNFSDSPMKKLKSVTFTEILHEFIPDVPWDKTGESDTTIVSEPELDELFRDIAPYAEEAIKKLANERLSGADTTARIDIPDVDFTLPMAPWNEYSSGGQSSGGEELDAQAKYLLRIKREDLKAASSWPGLASLTSKLGWNIFTAKISKIDLQEKLHGKVDLNKVLAEATSGQVATSSTQVWKPEGLRILDADEDEKEIELAQVEEQSDMDALIRKRKLEMDDDAPESHQKRTTSQFTPHSLSQQLRTGVLSSHWDNEPSVAPQHEPASHSAAGCARAASPTCKLRNNAKQAQKGSNNDLMFGGFSATTALHKFMETRGKAVEQASKKSVGTNQSGKDDQLPTNWSLPLRSEQSSTEHLLSVPKQPLVRAAVEETHHAPTTPRAPLPLLSPSPAPCSFIISNDFLQQRHLLKHIEQLYENADMVYRDYDRPHSPAKEADMSLSPSTGLIMTTLQQIKQRPLPGQAERSPVKERMAGLHMRYERLVVMISEGLSRDMEKYGSSRPKDSRDQEAIKCIEGFASNLEAEVIIKYAPGGEETLAYYIVVEMVKYGLAHGSQDIGDIKPVAVETTWEVFLRRVGVNPFAAQVIIASLKDPLDLQLPSIPSSPASPSPLVSGLSAFLLMNEKERITYFQAMMGGSRILKRVSRMLDQEWISAAHGFRL